MTSWERIVSEDGPLWEGRRPRGVPLVRVLSRDEAVRARPLSRGVVISIRAPSMEPPRLSSRWKAVLSLEIEDVDLQGNLDPGVDLRAPGEAIAAFVQSHRRVPQILLHCHAGASRSRSAAAAICEAYGWPYHWTVLHQPLHDAVLAALRHHAGVSM
jgi:predicted protein tyrosine phosphatase